MNYLGRKLNDNLPKLKGGLDQVPITAEDWRHPPVIEAEPQVRWFCLVTAPQGEYRTADALSDAGVATYVPTDTRWTRRRKGRDMLRVQVQAPVFRGYLFCRIASPCDWEPVYARDAFGRSRAGVIGVIGAHGAPVAMPLRSRELRDGQWVRCGIADFADEEREGWFNEDLRPALIAGRDAKPEPLVLAGEKVRIVDGAFAGYEGIAENDNDRSAARIAVSLFGQQTIMTVSLQALENLTRPQSADVALRRA
jgi:transcription antitermination factor NusG